MKDYWKLNPRKLCKYANLTFHRRQRRLPTSKVLNEWFKDSELHHISPEVAIHIPKQLHRGSPHNLRTGKGMHEINARVSHWFGGFCKVSVGRGVNLRLLGGVKSRWVMTSTSKHVDEDEEKGCRSEDYRRPSKNAVARKYPSVDAFLSLQGTIVRIRRKRDCPIAKN